MDVIAKRISKKSNIDLHWEFMRETCKTFNANLFECSEVMLPSPSKNVICLRHDKGIPLHLLNLHDVDTVLVGCDDSDDNGWMQPYNSVSIITPVNHHLWSGVALGIVLHHRFLMQNDGA